MTIAHHGPSPLPKVLAACGLLGVLLIGGALMYRANDGKPSELNAPLVNTAEPIPIQQPAALTVAGVEIPDARRIDATDLLHVIQKRLGSEGATVSLVDITVSAARGTSIDLTQADTQIAYRFITTRRDPLAAPVKGGDKPGMRLVFKQGAPADAESISITTADVPAPEPTCVWVAAFRAAIASGLPAEGPLDVRYAMSSKPNTASWVFTAADGSTRGIDGRTCAIFAQ